MKRTSIIVEQSKPFDEIEDSFVVSGWVPKSWVDEEPNNTRVRCYILDVDGDLKMTRDINFNIVKTTEVNGKLWFSDVVELSFSTFDWITQAQGRIILELKGEEIYQEFYIPIIIKGYQTGEKIDPEILDKHAHLGEMILKNYEDIDTFYKKLKKIEKDSTHIIKSQNRRKLDIELNVTDEKIAQDILEEFKTPQQVKIALYNKAKQDREENILIEQHKDHKKGKRN
jgi:hypothetical protein